MTLAAYLDTITVTKNDGTTGPLYYTFNGQQYVNGSGNVLERPPTDQPYVRIQALISHAAHGRQGQVRTHEGSLAEIQSYLLHIYHKALEREAPPDPDASMRLKDALMRASEAVTAADFDQVLLGRFRYEGGLDVQEDETTSGLHGFVRLAAFLWRPSLPT